MLRRYKIDVYDAILTITDDPTVKEVGKDLDFPSPMCILGVYKQQWNPVIYLPRGNLREAVHESVHAAVTLLDKLWVKVDVDNQEAVAYLTDFIFSKCYDFIERNNYDKHDQ